jgi:pimeloyl-ACP methyl ester carboxylesterase
MLHGWMDVGASFQFVVDALKGDWHVIAPDWRGFGLSDRSGDDTYWFPDYLADLDAILRHYSPDNAVDIVGHSMGGNILGLYAGARPERIRKLVNLEGAGLRAAKPEQAPGRYAKWMDGLLEKPELRTYPSRQAVAARLQKTNPRLSDERAAFLSQHWSAQNEQGEWEILGDPVHKQQGPLPYNVDEVMACWKAITAPVLWVEADQTNMWDGRAGRAGTPPRPFARCHPQDGARCRPYAAPRPAGGTSRLHRRIPDKLKKWPLKQTVIESAIYAPSAAHKWRITAFRLIRPTNILPARHFFGMIDRMNPHNTTVTNHRHVAADAGRAAFAGCGRSVSIIRIIQGR